MTMVAAGILGTGIYLPEQRLSNEELSRRFRVPQDAILARTGIKNRRIAAQGQACSDLAIPAARQAMTNSNSSPEEIGMVIVTTSTGDHSMPATAALVQNALGIPGAACFDLVAACTGFVYGFFVGCHAVSSGFCRKVLLVSSEVSSCITDPDGLDCAVLFGDGAGAVVIGSVPEGYGLLATDTGTDGSAHAVLVVPAGGSRLPASRETLEKKQQYLQMDGMKVFAFAMRTLGETISRVTQKAGLTLADIALFVPHQANRRIIEAAAGRLSLPIDRFYISLEDCGNTSSASIPLALHDALGTGKIKHDDLLVLTGFGSGVSWGSALVRWHSRG